MHMVQRLVFRHLAAVLVVFACAWSPLCAVAADLEARQAEARAAADTLLDHVRQFHAPVAEGGPLDQARAVAAARQIPLGCGPWEMPPGVELVDVTVPSENSAKITVRLPHGKRPVRGEEDGALLERIGRGFHALLVGHGFDETRLFALDPDTGERISFTDLTLVEKPIQVQEVLADPQILPLEQPGSRNIPRPPQGNRTGLLSGKLVVLNQGHGWYDNVDTLNRYALQRGNISGIVEDFSNAETMNNYTIPYLMNAGALVMTVRERDSQTNMVIVDDADGTSNPSNGTYSETGAWSGSTGAGFRQKTTASWVGKSVNPFGTASSSRFANANAAAVTATARWTPNIPAAGYYWVYISYSGSANRTTSAQYLVHHTGGTSEFLVNQQLTQLGQTWLPLGQFYFDAGSNSAIGSVELTNKTTGGSIVSSDAVRFGGGMGDVARQTHGISGRPRWEEEAVLYLQWSGFGRSGFLYAGTDDYSGGLSDRPQYAQWLAQSGLDTIYLANHTNAFDGVATGTRSISDLTGVIAASTTFRNVMNTTVRDGIRAQWAPTWAASTSASDSYGENNQANLGPNVPGFLFEGLFHDNVALDNAYYRQPRFRRIFGKSIARGFIRYFAERDAVTPVYPPDPPTRFGAIQTGQGTVTLNWTAATSADAEGLAGGAATGWLVYRSTHGYGFDDGTVVAGGATTSTVISGLTPEQLYFFRVAATNTGGRSVPTETLAVRLSANATPGNGLLVNAFDREDEGLVPVISITNAGNTHRSNHLLFNTFDYTVQHAKSLHAAGVSFGSVSNERFVQAGAGALANTKGIFWITGEESTVNETFSDAEQAIVTTFLATVGRGLFVSGSELAWDIDNRGTAGDKAFCSGTLKLAYSADDAATYNVAAAAGSIFNGLAGFNFNPASGAPYDAEFPDVLTPTGGSVSALTYSGGTGGTAGIVYDGTHRIVAFGFPFETISTATARDQVMARVVEFFELNATPRIGVPHGFSVR